jgi:hypothetical protein
MLQEDFFCVLFEKVRNLKIQKNTYGEFIQPRTASRGISDTIMFFNIATFSAALEYGKGYCFTLSANPSCPTGTLKVPILAL